MIFSFLTEDNIYTKYEASEVYTTALTKPFPEFDRIARNRPHDGIDPAYPKTTDGTTASIIRKTPRRIIQQIPTGTVVSEDNGWLGIVAEYIFTEQIIPQATEDYSLIQKAWTVIEKGLTFGSCMTYTPFINHDGKFSPDLSIPYWGDVFLQKGKKSGYSCSYIFMRSWWQPDDIKSLIDSETKLIAQSKKSKTNYQPTWDIGALQQVIDNETAKDARASTPDDKERGIEASGVELITGFQKGKGAVFMTFSPSAKVIVRRKINKDPRGKMPIDWMYGDIDGTNPLGRGIVELVGGLQNLIDSDMQMYQFNRALALAPPVLQFGNMKSFKYAPNVVVKTTDPNAHITPIVVDTSAIANYPSLYGMQKSQLLNLVNSPDTSISSEVGNPGFGKSQRYSEPVLSAEGWKRMGELVVGERVIDNYGQPAEILEIHEQGELDTYDVTFRDGSVANSSLDHLWAVYNKSTKKYETVTLEHIINNTVRYKDGECHYYVDLVQPIEFDKKQLPIDPYLLGLLLGDGGFTDGKNTISFTNSKPHIITSIEKLLPTGSEIYQKGSKTNEYRIRGINTILEDLGLLGHLAKDKFIPEQYLLSTVEDRQRLFNGLIDTDGHRLKGYEETIQEYSTVSPALSEGVLDLARSLGLYASITVGTSTTIYKGERRTYGNKYRVNINRKKRKAILSVEKVGNENSRCLYVDTPDHLYVTTGYTITHNTPAALQQQQTVISVDDNYVDKMFETWFQSWGEGTINMYFAEHSGIEELQLNKETAMRLRELEGFDQTMLSPDNKIMIDYDTATPALKLRVNPSTSKKKDNAEQTSNASNLLDMVMKYPMLNSNYGGPIDIEVLARRIVVNSGIDDPEQVAPEPTEAQKQSKEQQKNTVSPFSPMFDKPSIRMNYPDLPMAAQIQVLSNAGVHVSPEDMMQGPVVDPNMRGVMNPMSDPNALLPGGQPGQPNAPQTPQAAPIDLGDIYKLTTDPAVKAQIEKMAGLQPDQANVEDNIATNMATHAASQANSVGSIMSQPPQQPTQQPQGQPTQQPQEEQQEQGQPMNVPQESSELSPEDQQIIRHLQALGLPPHVIQQAIQMAEQNVPAEQILQAIGVSNG